MRKSRWVSDDSETTVLTDLDEAGLLPLSHHQDIGRLDVAARNRRLGVNTCKLLQRAGIPILRTDA